MKRAAIYRRTTTGDTQNLQQQLAACHSTAEQAGLHVVETVDDINPGKTMNRPGIARLRELADANAIDTVVVANLTRLGRKPSDVTTLTDQLSSRNVTVMSAQPAGDPR